jgi:hypothetical protein
MTEAKPPELFELKPPQANLATYAVARAASDPLVLQELDRVSKLLAQAPRVLVTNDETYARAGDLVKMIKVSRKKLDDFRKDLTGPVDKALKSVNKYFRDSAFAGIDSAEAQIKAKMGIWFRAEEERRRAEALRAQEAAEAEALALADQAAQQGQEAAANSLLEAGIASGEAEIKAAKIGPGRGEHGAVASAKKVWKWKLADASQVPRAYLTVDTMGITAAVLEGVREIPGIEIYEDIQVAIR